MDKTELANLRRDYSGRKLSKDSVCADPIEQFSIWLDEALHSEITDANAMTLATAGCDGQPSARVVLLKDFDTRGFVFFTNYESRKADDIASNPKAALTFFWPQLQRQVIIDGIAEKISGEESENYFKTRPLDSKVGAWASKQSSVVGSRLELEEKFKEISERFGEDVPLPPFWGGYRVVPNRIEFWQGRESRLHDRICYELADGDWQIVRLSP